VSVRWIILICVVGVHFFQQASDIDAIVLYSPLMFRKTNMSSNKVIIGATVSVDVIKMCFVLVATLFSNRLSRRPLLHASTAGVAASMVSLGVMLCVGVALAASMAANILSVLAFMAVLSICFGPLAGTYSAKIMPLRLHAQGACLGMAVHQLTCAL
jgi:MFS family permease